MSESKKRSTKADADARAKRARRTAQVRAYLEGRPARELVRYILQIARRHRSIRRDLVQRTSRAAHAIAVKQEREAKIVRAEQGREWSALAALRAEAFLAAPSLATLEALQEAANKVGCGAQVRTAALYFLETGKLGALSASMAPHGQLPHRKKKHGPRLHVLLELALKEQRPDDVLRLFDLLRASAPQTAARYRERVADAIVATNPERAVELYWRVIERLAAQNTPQAHEATLPYLRKIRGLLHQHGLPADWASYLAALRQSHRDKPRFLEMLDRVEGRRPGG
jgi:uncharacterized Zn finger protein